MTKRRGGRKGKGGLKGSIVSFVKLAVRRRLRENSAKEEKKRNCMS